MCYKKLQIVSQKLLKFCYFNFRGSKLTGENCRNKYPQKLLIIRYSNVKNHIIMFVYKCTKNLLNILFSSFCNFWHRGSAEIIYPSYMYITFDTMDHLRPGISSIHNFLLTFPTNFHLILTFALSRILQHTFFVKTTVGIRFVKYTKCIVHV